MKVYVNGEAVAVFEGARVIDAVRAYVGTRGIKVDIMRVAVRDGDGNSVDYDGALTDGALLRVELPPATCGGRGEGGCKGRA